MELHLKTNKSVFLELQMIFTLLLVTQVKLWNQIQTMNKENEAL